MENIIQNKEQILYHFYEWAETFNPENMIFNSNNEDEEVVEEMHKSYEYVLNLAIKLENNKCTKKDFHFNP